MNVDSSSASQKRILAYIIFSLYVYKVTKKNNQHNIVVLIISDAFLMCFCKV